MSKLGVGRLVLLSMLVGFPVFAGKKVLVLGIDGLRPEALEKARTPNLDKLITKGLYNANAKSGDLTFSGPNWSSILHGVYRDKHGVTTNDYKGNKLRAYPDLFQLIRNQKRRLVLARLSSWDMLYQNQPTGAQIDIFHDYDKDDGDAKITAAAVKLLSNKLKKAPDGPDVAFVYYADVDVAGHTHGFHPSAAKYIAEIEEVDGQVGRLLKAIKKRKSRASEHWMILVTSDHGGSFDGVHHGNTPEKRTIPFIMCCRPKSSKVTQSYLQPKNVDIVKTVLNFLNLKHPKSLDGHAITWAGEPKRKVGQNVLANSGSEQDRGFLDGTFDQYIRGWQDDETKGVTSIQYGAPGGWPLAASKAQGKNFLMGGTIKRSHLTQKVGVPTNLPMGVFKLSAMLGGFEDQDDHAEVLIKFLDRKGRVLKRRIVGPVLAKHRAKKTTLVSRSLTGAVPKGSMLAEVVVTFVRVDGEANDGYADNVELRFY